jgi:hypothetical protein
VAGLPSLHPWRLLLYLLASVADFAITCHLVVRTDGAIHESNPLASAWLSCFGWVGLAVFKGLATLQVMLAAILISRRRPRLGGGILSGGCAVTAAVVLYGCYLAIHDGTVSVHCLEEIRRANHASRLLDWQRERERKYQTQLVELCNDVIVGRWSLAEAANQLNSSEKARNQHWMNNLRQRYPGYSDVECLALYLIRAALAGIDHNPALMERIKGKLAIEFRTAYGTEIPWQLYATNVSLTCRHAWAKLTPLAELSC